MNRFVYYDPATSICAWWVGPPGNTNRLKIVWNGKESILSILGNCTLDLSTASFKDVCFLLDHLLLNSVCRSVTLLARTDSSANLRTTTKCSMADDRGDGECVWKHSGFCKDGDVLIKSLTVCRICKSQVKILATRLTSPTTYKGAMGFHTMPTAQAPLAVLLLQQQHKVTSALQNVGCTPFLVLQMYSFYVVNNSRSSRNTYC